MGQVRCTPPAPNSRAPPLSPRPVRLMRRAARTGNTQRTWCARILWNTWCGGATGDVRGVLSSEPLLRRPRPRRAAF